ncbi:MAG: hypothetical protein AAF889_02215 [Cyanobacteria bacterium P01_D01_bin.73]
MAHSCLHLWTPDSVGQPKLLQSLVLSPDLAQRLDFYARQDPKALQALIGRLGCLDFGPLVQKLWDCHCQSYDGEDGWSRSRLYRAVQSYAGFLLDAALQPDVPLPAISGDMDEVWHCHILQTQKYTDDCKDFFGYYLHHEGFPQPAQTVEACHIGVRRDHPSAAAAGSDQCTVGIHRDRPPVAAGGGQCNIGIRRTPVSIIAGTGACRISRAKTAQVPAQAA